MHIDMDAFFASVEQLDHPGLRGRPVAVGGIGPRSVVSAASYEMRAYGVHSAMPMARARKLCPGGAFVPLRMSRYREVSRLVMAALREFSPLVEQASVDEAYLDAAGLSRLFGPPRDMAAKIKARVREVSGLTCSVGAAPVRFLAKIASDLDKPDGLTVIRPEEVRGFLARLPVDRIPGVGGRTLERLKALGVRLAGDVLGHPESFWRDHLGERGQWLHERARGVDRSGVEPSRPARSVSAENTFERDTRDRDELRLWLLRQAERVGADLRSCGLAGRTVTLKVKFSDFRQLTRSRTLAEAVCDTAGIFGAALSLLDGLQIRDPVRLVGLGVSKLGPAECRLGLLGPGPALRRGRLDRAVDAVRQRFGTRAVVRGDLLDPGRPEGA
ncbi:MAG: DNA polymerase IV [Desulfovibrionaceae bacterium]|nr:DNA polymerase IV [Desulfovibrionaceae bacterium]